MREPRALVVGLRTNDGQHAHRPRRVCSPPAALEVAPVDGMADEAPVCRWSVALVLMTPT